MPEKFVAPRHILLKVLLIKNGDLDDIFLDLNLQTSHMFVFSTDQTFFEGFLLLKLENFIKNQIIFVL